MAGNQFKLKNDVILVETLPRQGKNKRKERFPQSWGRPALTLKSFPRKRKKIKRQDHVPLEIESVPIEIKIFMALKRSFQKKLTLRILPNFIIEKESVILSKRLALSQANKLNE